MKKKVPSCAPKTAVAYARYSSAGQRDVSIDQQLADIRAFAQREGYTIVHEYADHAKSGFKRSSARVEFQAMLTAAGSGSFDTIIAWKVDRFGRNRRESAIYKGQLSDHGVSVIYAADPIPFGAAGVLTEGMLESIAEWYSRNLAENVSRGMNDNAKKCISNGIKILGYKRGPDNRYEIDPDCAAVVRRIFDLYISGYSAAAIARMLNDQNLKPARGKDFKPQTVLYILSSECYIGVYSWGEYRIPGGMPPIISDDDWRRAQEMKKKTGRHIEKSPVEFLLTGKVFCGHCGRPMVGDSGTSRNGMTHYYYSCTGKKSRGGYAKSCDKKSIRKEILEDKVIDFIYGQCLTGPEMEKIADAIIAAQKEYEKSSPLAAMEAELKETQKKIDNVNDAIEAGIWNSSTSVRLKTLEDAAEALRSHIAEIQFSRAQMLDKDLILKFLGKMSKYKRDDPERRRQLINTFINAVFVFDDHLRITINAIDGNSQISLADVTGPDLDSGPGSGSTNDKLSPLYMSHPNKRTVTYLVSL